MIKTVPTLSALAVLLGLALSASGAQAQQLSPEADQAFWCAGAYATFVNKGAFASNEQQNLALSDLSRFEAVMQAEGTRLGWDQKAVETLALSYGEEVEPQVDDYLLWKDPAALRLSLSDCFPSAGL